MRMDQSAIPRWNFRVPVTNFTCSTTRTIPMISFVHENWPICESKCEIDYYINCKQCGLSKRKRIVGLKPRCHLMPKSRCMFEAKFHFEVVALPNQLYFDYTTKIFQQFFDAHLSAQRRRD